MKAFFLSSLSKAINSYLELDPDSKQRLHKLQGKAMTIELLPFHLVFQCIFTEHGVNVQDEEILQSDTFIRGTPLQMLGVMVAKQNRHQFFADDLVIEGNAELGQQMIALFDELQIDWEEHFSRLMGDVPAYHVSRFIKGVGQWFKQAEQAFSQDVNDYVHEEAEWFPSSEAMGDFLHSVDALHMDVDRAEAKIKHLRSLITEEDEVIK